MGHLSLVQAIFIILMFRLLELKARKAGVLTSSGHNKYFYLGSSNHIKYSDKFATCSVQLLGCSIGSIMFKSYVIRIEN